MRHIEDLAFGTNEELLSLAHILKAFCTYEAEVTEKIDGAPSFIFGAGRKGSPFIAYKSGLEFPFWSKEEILASDVACKEKLAAVWIYVEAIVKLNKMRGEAWQCDMMSVPYIVPQFDKDGWFVFKPNLIEYKFTTAHAFMFAPHTRYRLCPKSWKCEGSVAFNLKMPHGAKAIQNVVSPDKLKLHAPIAYEAAQKAREKLFQITHDKFEAVISKYKLWDDVEYALNKFGKEAAGEMAAALAFEMFFSFLNQRIDDRFGREIVKLKTEKGKQNKRTALDQAKEELRWARSSMFLRFDAYRYLFAMKSRILEQATALSTVPTVEQSYEGFVIKVGNDFTKLVDRPRFSRLNSDISTKKGWHATDEADIQNTTPAESDDQ
jgi:hypothetical protein